MRRRTTLPRFAVVLAALALASCADEPPDPFDDARCQAFLNDPETADALDWLKAPAPVPRRPGNMSVDAALSLAHKYDARGAMRVLAVGNRKLNPPAANEPCLVSLGLLIQPPDEPSKRYAVFKLYAEQVRNNGYAPRADTGQKYLFVGWPQD